MRAAGMRQYSFDFPLATSAILFTEITSARQARKITSTIFDPSQRRNHSSLALCLSNTIYEYERSGGNPPIRGKAEEAGSVNFWRCKPLI